MSQQLQLSLSLSTKASQIPVAFSAIALHCLVPFRKGARSDTWRSTVESVHSDVGYAPAMAMLSAYGFYNGQSRDDPGGGPAARTGDWRPCMPASALTCDVLDEVSCCVMPAMPRVGRISNRRKTGLRPRRSCAAALRADILMFVL